MNLNNTISYRPRALATLLALMFSGSLWAASSPNPVPVLRGAELERVEMTTERVRRERILQDTQNTFTLLGAEMALLNGNPHLALNTYVAILEKTRAPEVAERAMELAIHLQNYPLAEDIFSIWQKIEPNSNPTQRRILWTRALASNDTQYVFANLNTILNEANEEQVRRIFLLLSQVSVQNPSIAQQGKQAVHQAAWQHAEMPEAMVADMLFLLPSDKEKDLQKTLAQLAKIDAEVSDVSRLGLSMMVRQKPNALIDFFDKHDSRKMSSRWQELEFESLIQAKEYQKAEKRLQHLLKHQPENATLYLLAGVHAYEQDKNSLKSIEYLQKSHQYALEPQKSRAAVLLALRFMTDKKYAESKQWIERIQSPAYSLDKRVLMASLASEQENFHEAARLSVISETAEAEAGHFFQLSDLQMLHLYALNQTLSPEKMLRELNRLIQHAQKHAQMDFYSSLLYQRGLLYVDKLNRWHDGVADLRAYYALNPNKADAQNALGYTLLSKPDSVEEGFALIMQAYKQDPENPAINDSLGWAYVKKGDYPTALMYLQFAYDRFPDAEVAAHLGEVHWYLGERDKAQTVWKAAWEKSPKDPILLETLQRFGVKF